MERPPPYLGMEMLPWLTTDWMLAQIGKSATKARAAYTAFVLDGLEEERRPEFHGAGVDSRLLGDDNFMNKCLSGSGGMALHLTAQQIIEKASLAYHLDAVILKAKSQQRIASEARAVAGWLACQVGESGCGEYQFLRASFIRSHSGRARTGQADKSSEG